MKSFFLKLDREIVAMVLVVALVGLGIANFAFTSRIERRYNQLIENDLSKLHHLHLLGTELSNRQRFLLNLALADGQQSEIDVLTVKVANARQRAQLLMEHYHPEDSPKDADAGTKDMAAALAAYDALNNDYIKLVKEGQTDQAVALNEQSMRPAYENLQKQLTALATATKDRAEQFSREAGRSITITRLVLLAIALSPILIWLAMLTWVFAFFAWCLLTSRDDKS